MANSYISKGHHEFEILVQVSEQESKSLVLDWMPVIKSTGRISIHIDKLYQVLTFGTNCLPASYSLLQI